MKWAIPLAGAIALICAGAVAAAERFGVEDRATAERLEAELNAILLSPSTPDARGDDAPPDDVAPLLKLDPGLQEAWRADPQATLNLIQRIRDAGGLKN